jgi:trimethylamine:corrinoid methyltransferase-like protein
MKVFALSPLFTAYHGNMQLRDLNTRRYISSIRRTQSRVRLAQYANGLYSIQVYHTSSRAWIDAYTTSRWERACELYTDVALDALGIKAG